MANALYPKFKQALLNKEHDMDTDAIQATLIDSGAYTYAASHASYTTDVPAGAKIAVSPNLTAPTIIDGVFDTADFTWTAVTGAQSEAIIVYNNTHATKGLSAFYDTGMTGMPVTPNGGNINVTVHASGWFAL
jgi:hypothetical protein